MERYTTEHPELAFSVDTTLNKDDSTDGDITITGVDALEPRDFHKLLLQLSDPDNKWPFAKGQTGEDRDYGAFWFSVAFDFTVPDNRKWRYLEDHYKRLKGHVWQTSTYWRHSSEGNLTLIDAASWGKQHNKSIPELMGQEKFGYKVKQIKLRLVWTPDGEKPNWR